MLIPFLYYTGQNIQQIEKFMRDLLFNIMFEAPKHQGGELKDVVPSEYKPLFKFHLKNKKLVFTVISNKLYKEFQQLSEEQIEVLKKAYQVNNQIKDVCHGDIVPIRFADLNAMFDTVNGKAFLKDLQAFCELQYTSCLDLAEFKKKFGSLDDYYKKLVGNDDVCHCCGIGTVLTNNNSHRDAFDHYLSKKKYPFVSVNFRNLIPICDACNSLYKNQKDTLFYVENGIELRRKVFYPFYENGDEVPYKIKIGIHLACCYKTIGIKADMINLIYDCPGHDEEVDSWRELYGIDERYKAYCMSKRMQVKIKSLYDKGIEDKSFLSQYLLLSGSLPEIDNNFLVVPFVKAVFESLNIKQKG